MTTEEEWDYLKGLIRRGEAFLDVDGAEYLLEQGEESIIRNDYKECKQLYEDSRGDSSREVGEKLKMLQVYFGK